MTKNETIKYIQSCAEEEGPTTYEDAAAIFAALFDRLPDAEDGTAADLWSHCCAAANEHDEVIEPITDDVIDALCVEAGAAGDTAMVEVCQRAKEGDGAALVSVARAINDAAANA
jgi:hypothetical protein